MAIEIVVNGKKLDGDEIVILEKTLRNEMRNTATQLSSPALERGTSEFNRLSFKRKQLSSIVLKLEDQVKVSVVNK